MKTISIAAAGLFLFGAAALVPPSGFTDFTTAHDAHGFSAGQPGKPNAPARTVKLSMAEEGKRMFYQPSHIIVRKG